MSKAIKVAPSHQAKKACFTKMLMRLPIHEQAAIKQAINVLASESNSNKLNESQRLQFFDLVKKCLSGDSITSNNHPTYQCKHCINISTIYRNEQQMRICGKQGAHVCLPLCPYWELATGSDDELTGMCYE